MKNQKDKGKPLLFTLKLIVTLALSVIILWNVDWNEIWMAIKNANTILIGVIFILMVFNVFNSALKWKILLTIHNIYFHFNQLYKYYFTAVFFNNFLPSTVGGDGYRIYKTYKNPHSKSGAVLAVLMERITGLLALLLLGYIGTIVVYVKSGDEIARIGLIIGSIGLGIFMISLFAFNLKRNLFCELTGKCLPKKFRPAIAHIQDYYDKPSKTVLVLALSLFFQFVLLCNRLLLVVAVGESLSVFQLAIAITASTVIALVPISLNGIGLLDGSFIYLLVHFGIGYEQALLVMVLIRALAIPLSLFGGIFYFLDKRSFKNDDCNHQEVQTV
jgi:hypothetical protein